MLMMVMYYLACLKWQFILLYYTVYIKTVRGRVSVRPSHRLTAAATCGGFAAELGCRQQISIDSCRHHVPIIDQHLLPHSHFVIAARHAGRENLGPTARRSNIFLFQTSSGHHIHVQQIILTKVHTQ